MRRRKVASPRAPGGDERGDGPTESSELDRRRNPREAPLQDFVGPSEERTERLKLRDDGADVQRVEDIEVEAPLNRMDRSFWTADRPVEGGKARVKNLQQIEARRTGPPRSMNPRQQQRGGR